MRYNNRCYDLSRFNSNTFFFPFIAVSLHVIDMEDFHDKTVGVGRQEAPWHWLRYRGSISWNSKCMLVTPNNLLHSPTSLYTPLKPNPSQHIVVLALKLFREYPQPSNHLRDYNYPSNCLCNWTRKQTKCNTRVPATECYAIPANPLRRNAWL